MYTKCYNQNFYNADKHGHYKPVSQSGTVPKSDKFWRATGQSNLADEVVLSTKVSNFAFRTHTTALWPMEQSSILSAKFDCSVACQNCSLLATAHDCETGLFDQSGMGVVAFQCFSARYGHNQKYKVVQIMDCRLL